MNKKKILILADSPLAPSGIGTQTKYMIEPLIKTGEFSFVCLAGAVKHADYTPMKVQPYEDDWVIIPVDGYGNPDTVRAVIEIHKPDLIWFMTDPRFWIWLWEMENEVRPNIPMLYYHVWDNYPYPDFNADYYKSNDVVCTISKVTDDIVRTLAPEVETIHIPHTVDTNIFKKKDKSLTKSISQSLNSDGKMVFFWNNRNARRKQSGTLLFWFKEFLDIVGKENAMLVMHTEPKDPNGQDLEAIIRNLGMTSGEVFLSVRKVDASELSLFYNLADCTVNIADAEGFGLSTLESLACETPVIVNMTGGLQEQVTDGVNWFGKGLQPASKAVIGSQDVPYIYEDRLNKQDFINAMVEFYNLSQEERDKMGELGRNHVMTNYSMSKYSGLWYDTITKTIEKHGSWENRKNYKSYTVEEL